MRWKSESHNVVERLLGLEGNASCPNSKLLNRTYRRRLEISMHRTLLEA